MISLAFALGIALQTPRFPGEVPRTLPSLAHLQPVVDRLVLALQSGSDPDPKDFLRAVKPSDFAALKVLAGCRVTRAASSQFTANQAQVFWICRTADKKRTEWGTLIQFSGDKIKSLELLEVEKYRG